jgi:hypothetical protein
MRGQYHVPHEALDWRDSACAEQLWWGGRVQLRRNRSIAHSELDPAETRFGCRLTGRSHVDRNEDETCYWHAAHGAYAMPRREH